MKYLLPLSVIATLSCAPTFAADNHHKHGHKEITIQDGPRASITPLSDRVHIIQSKGGNVGLFVGNSHLFLIDNDYKASSPAILDAIKTISDKEIKFLLNTHWHGDHTGGNEILGQSGTLILAHDNVRKRLSEDNYIAAFDMSSVAAPEIALPIVTYSNEMTLHLDGDPVRIIHVKGAHTDGDSIILFERDNVIHAGDIYFNGFYPFIDAKTGGTLSGMISATDVILDLANDQTNIIPGHGPISNKDELIQYRDMLISVRDIIAPMIANGKTFEEIKYANPLAPFNEKWGDGFLTPDAWLKIVYDAIK